MNAVTALKTSTERDLRAEIASVRTSDQRLTQAEISRQSGVHESRLSQWVNGRYPGDIEALEMELSRWLDAYYTRQLEAKALPAAPQFIAMPTSERILSAYGYAQLASDIAIIYGGAGVSKTFTAQHFQRTNPNVWIATMSPDTKSVVTALEEVAIAIGINVRGGAAVLRREICRRVSGTMGLLIIDEAHELGRDALEAMRTIHDRTSIGLVLQGNEQVYTAMTGGNRAAYLDRLFSRIGKRVRIVKPTARDIDSLIQAWGVGKDCAKVLHEIAAKPGGLRGMTKTLRLASMFAAGAGRPLACEDIRMAWRDLGGDV
jgi:DNA transposition AAA+ family ATPase